MHKVQFKLIDLIALVFEEKGSYLTIFIGCVVLMDKK